MSITTAEELGAKLTEIQGRMADDEEFRRLVQENPDKALSDAGFSPRLISRFRLLEPSKRGCSCSCWPLFGGTGVGCFATYPGAKGVVL